jgi:hypothetical protein
MKRFYAKFTEKRVFPKKKKKKKKKKRHDIPGLLFLAHFGDPRDAVQRNRATAGVNNNIGRVAVVPIDAKSQRGSNERNFKS